MYSYVLLRLTPDRFFQQSRVAEKYLDENKKKPRDDQITDTKRSFFFTRSPVFENYGILCSTCQPSIVILHSDALTNVQDCLPMHSLWSFVPWYKHLKFYPFINNFNVRGIEFLAICELCALLAGRYDQ